MKRLPLGLLVAAVTLASPGVSAQRFSRDAEREAMMKEHIAECEVCAGLDAQIKELEAELAELQRQKEALRLKRLEEKIEELAEDYPEAKEQLDQLLALRKKTAELEKELRETAASGREIIEALELEPEDSAALIEALGPFEQAAPGGRRFVRLHAQRMRLARMRDRNPELAERLDRMEAEQKKRLEALEESDPELYEIAVKEQALAKKLGDLRISLYDTMMEHLRSAQQPN